jgi:GMP reductase
MKEYFDFENVRIMPKKAIVESRDECSTEVEMGKFIFKNPVILANMLSIINEELAIKLAREKYCYIYHRFNHNNIDFVKKMNELELFTSISVGVKEESLNQLKVIKESNLNVDMICIDVAHGHSIGLERTVKYIKDLGMNSFVIGGNVCTEEAVEDLQNWGCDGIKAGIGPGSVCTTFNSTNVGSRNWQASCVYNLSKMAKVPIICDGGIKTCGSLCASLAMGSSMSMVGGMFAGFEDSPGDIVQENGKLMKEFFGSASEFTKGHAKYVEGKKTLVDYKHGSVIDYLNTSVNDALKSAISYCGGRTLGSLKNSRFIVI